MKRSRLSSVEIGSMSLEFRITKNLEWCTELPSKDCPRKTPYFFVNGNECFFRFALIQAFDGSWYYNLYLEVKRRSVEFEPCHLKLQIGFKTEETLSLANETLKVSERCSEAIWFIPLRRLNLMQRFDNRIKFVFCFDSTAEHRTEVSNKTEWPVTEESQVPPSLGTNFHLKALSRDLSKLLDESFRSDVEIMCDGKSFNAHRIILGMRSAVFSAMLQSNMVEGQTGLIQVEDFSACTLQSFLRYLYSGTLPELKVETAKQFYEIADKYAVEELKKACSEFFVKNLSQSNACDILILADKHSDLDFRKRVISYIVDKKIPQRDCQWTEFCENYCKLAIEVQNLYIQKYCPK